MKSLAQLCLQLFLFWGSKKKQFYFHLSISILWLLSYVSTTVAFSMNFFLRPEWISLLFWSLPRKSNLLALNILICELFIRLSFSSLPQTIFFFIFFQGNDFFHPFDLLFQPKNKEIVFLCLKVFSFGKNCFWKKEKNWVFKASTIFWVDQFDWICYLIWKHLMVKWIQLIISDVALISFFFIKPFLLLIPKTENHITCTPHLASLYSLYSSVVIKNNRFTLFHSWKMSLFEKHFRRWKVVCIWIEWEVKYSCFVKSFELH